MPKKSLQADFTQFELPICHRGKLKHTWVRARQTMVSTSGRLQATTWKCNFLFSRMSTVEPIALNVRCQE